MRRTASTGFDTENKISLMGGLGVAGRVSTAGRADCGM
jgi:hypothetical protein